MTLLKALTEDYLNSRKFTEAQKQEIEAWIWKHKHLLVSPERIMSTRQEHGASIRETSPEQDWSLAFGSSMFHRDEPDDEEELPRDWCPVVSFMVLAWLSGYLAEALGDLEVTAA